MESGLGNQADINAALDKLHKLAELSNDSINNLQAQVSLLENRVVKLENPESIGFIASD